MIGFSELYLDESGSDDRSPVLCLAGYVFKSKNAIWLSQDWQYVLDRYQVPYFRMSRCAHGNKPFHKLSKPQRIKLVTALIKIIRKYMTLGFAMTVVEKDFYELISHNKCTGGPYSFLLRQSLSLIVAESFKDEIAYFFESGHRDQSEANRIMQDVFKSGDPLVKEKYRYVSHTFADKQKMLPLQAADLLAWLWYSYSKTIVNNKPRMRKDLEALLKGKNYRVEHWNPDRLRGIAKLFQSLDDFRLGNVKPSSG
jgi:Protein of unknown function (DUF3800)